MAISLDEKDAQDNRYPLEGKNKDEGLHEVRNYGSSPQLFSRGLVRC